MSNTCVLNAPPPSLTNEKCSRFGGFRIDLDALLGDVHPGVVSDHGVAFVVLSGDFHVVLQRLQRRRQRTSRGRHNGGRKIPVISSCFLSLFLD